MPSWVLGRARGLPLTTAEDIVAEYRPGASITVKAGLRTLGEKCVISGGVPIRPRRRGGRMAGGLHLYSSVNLDAVRLYRRGDDDGARELARRAAELEQGDEMRELTQDLNRWLAEDPRGAQALIVLLIAVAGAALLKLTEKTESERRALGKRYVLDAPLFARIAGIDQGVAELRVEGRDSPILFPSADLSREPLDVGTGVALRWQALRPGMTLLTADPALDLEQRSGEVLYPYERPLPAQAGRVELTGALAAEPAIRRPARVRSISGTP